ncbi:sensor histidine kinase [Haloterrigena alkaliphila]|uniref:histidine kinase n=1 Tax=Haloterrigena alkaliphila TaxID=2816475 RepID=A0A8A2VHH0_9EURY|nr:HAMP domain-containing sensor histidine kinase [Haloterrigena alkaliphila]QSX00797.1 GAF domain-containing protein [Haloterrigena alkaliphila]
MSGVSNRLAGGILVAAGLFLSLFHLATAVGLRTTSVPLLVTVPPLVLSLGLIGAGALLARERLLPGRFAGRLLAWTCAGVLALTALAAWLFAATVVSGFSLLDPLTAMLNVSTFGALVGLLVGVYDARGTDRQRSIEQLNRINDTLRIATRELVNKTERSALERAVCERLSESDPYEAVWIGRYDEANARVRPAAWSGFDDEYFESIEITVDDSPTGNGPGGRAIKRREMQCVPNVFEDPTMEPWWDLLEWHGVQSLAVVPVGHGDTVYGFFSIYADRQNVFDDHERTVLTELGETIGHAIATIETRERLAERERELARQNERLDAFAGVVSHDLRNPLNVASGNLELAREERDDEYLSEVSDALARMDALIGDLLTLARQGELVDEFDRVPFRPLVESAWSTAGSSAATLRIEGDPGVISCDRDRLRQLLENLFRNCVEHGSTGSRPQADDSVEHGSANDRPAADEDSGDPGVTVTVRRTNAGFVVEDDGPGIPADRREAVFEMGYTTNAEGTGFGLNIVRSIAEAHGWDVSVDESAADGARFEFSGVEPVESEQSAR